MTLPYCSGEPLTSLVATIVNSDMIPFRKRGMYQALQNGMFGFGAICGASFGGSIADGIGWRWCFLLQVPISAFALAVGALVVKNPEGGFDLGDDVKAVLTRVDFSGSLLLVTAISIQLVGLSLGGNELPWGSPWVVSALFGSTALFAAFLVVEARTRAIPIIPLRLLHGRLPVLVQFANICVGLSAYAVSSMPLTHLGRSLTACTVSVQFATVLSDCALGLGYNCRGAPRNPVSRDADRRTHCGSGDVEMGEAASPCQDGSAPDDGRKRFSGIS
jgi:MFS family permease